MTSGERSRYGLVVSALGAVVLAVSVFLPWYGVSMTSSGVAYFEQVGRQVVGEFGNASLQGYFANLHGLLSAAVGQQLVALSAHQTLHVLGVVLLVLAALALLDTMLALARPAASAPAGAGASVVVLGGLATAFVAYRMLVPPTPAGGLLALSLREGAWLALLGSMMIALGALWPRVTRAAGDPDAQLQRAFSGLSGWTPGA
ncbi:MAG TPA: hypothetical protein VGN13_00935 [Solirubrobacteraceae bacterium]|jgi:hypothetical protein